MYVKRKTLHMSEAEIDAFLGSNIWGRLATASLAADPHLTPIGYVYYQGNVYFSSLRKSRRGRNLSENTKTALLVDDGVAPGEDYTKRRGVILYGQCIKLDEDEPVLADVRREFARVMGAKSLDELKRGTHDWYRLSADKKVSWDFRKIPSGMDPSADKATAGKRG